MGVPSILRIMTTHSAFREPSHGVLSRTCGRCNRIFSKSEHLRRHERSQCGSVDTGERPFKCRWCGKTYARSDVLSRHIRNHHLVAADEGGHEWSETPAPPTEYNDQTEQVRIEPTTSETGNSYSVLSANLLANNGPDIDDRPPTDSHNENNLPQRFPATPLLDNGSNYQQHQDSFELSFDAGSHLELLGDQAMDLDLAILPSFLNPNLTGDGPSIFMPQKMIPDEQLERVEQFWPARRKRTARTPELMRWQDILDHTEDNLFSAAALPNDARGLAAADNPDSTWNLTKHCYDLLVHDCSDYLQRPSHTSSVSPSASGNDIIDGTSNSDEPSPSSRTSWGSGFPPADIIDMSLDLYFYHCHTFVSVIHASTFDASMTPSELLFPMCLIGLKIFNHKAGRRLIHNCLPAVIDRHREIITSKDLYQCPAPQLLTSLAGVCLVLFVAATTPEVAYEEKCQALYEEVMSLMHRRAVFKVMDHFNNNTTTTLSYGSRATWSAWARGESAKRVINSLAMMDVFFAHTIGIGPFLRPHDMSISLPCPDEMFTARTVDKWKNIVDACEFWHWNTPVFQPDVSNIPLPGVGGCALEAVLVSFWTRISHAHHRLLKPAMAPEHHPPRVLVPCEFFATDPEALSITPDLVRIFQVHQQNLSSQSASLSILWQFLCILTTVNLDILESAAGRDGPQAARDSLYILAAWSQSPSARRACLHASHMMVTTHRRKISDGITLHSELALFTAALVLGFYLMTCPATGADESNSIDLLSEVDWAAVGNEGLYPVSQLREGTSSSSNPAVRFIREGGSVNFDGTGYRSGYGAARRSFMNFASLLEEVGKWNVQGYCRILRIISDTLVEPETCCSE